LEEDIMTILVGGKASEEVRRYLEGIQFPALKDEVVRHVRHAQAPNEIVAMIQRLDVTEFDSPEHVLRAWGEMPGAPAPG
jgi:hypothetical protein